MLLVLCCLIFLNTTRLRYHEKRYKSILLLFGFIIGYGFIIHDRLICCTDVRLLENDSILLFNPFKFGRWEGEQLAPLYTNCPIGT